MRIRFGIGLPTGFPTRDPDLGFLDFAERAEELGYDSLWAGDHVVFHIPRFEVFSVLAAVASRTRRAEIGSAVLLLCLRNPVHVAQISNTIDHISGGRFILGVGVGGEHPKEFHASGVSPRERGARTDEALSALRRLWSDERPSFHGRFFHFDDLPVPLRPQRLPHPPVWIGGRSPAALRRAATFGNAWFPAFVTPEGFRERSEQLDRLCADAGRSPRDVSRSLFLFVGVGDDAARARTQVERFLRLNYAMPFEPFRPYVVTGTPRECADGIARFLDAGAEHVAVRFATGEPGPQLETWTREVLPRLREYTPQGP